VSLSDAPVPCRHEKLVKKRCCQTLIESLSSQITAEEVAGVTGATLVEEMPGIVVPTVVVARTTVRRMGAPRATAAAVASENACKIISHNFLHLSLSLPRRDCAEKESNRNSWRFNQLPRLYITLMEILLEYCCQPFLKLLIIPPQLLQKPGMWH
jgi:hypothetical protein